MHVHAHSKLHVRTHTNRSHITIPGIFTISSLKAVVYFPRRLYLPRRASGHWCFSMIALAMVLKHTTLTTYLSKIIIDLLIALGDDISECCIADISILLQKKDCQLCLTVESSLVEGRFLEERLEHHD